MTIQDAITLVTAVLAKARDEGAHGEVYDALLDCISTLQVLAHDEKGVT